MRGSSESTVKEGSGLVWQDDSESIGGNGMPLVYLEASLVCNTAYWCRKAMWWSGLDEGERVRAGEKEERKKEKEKKDKGRREKDKKNEERK